MAKYSLELNGSADLTDVIAVLNSFNYVIEDAAIIANLQTFDGITLTEITE